MKEAPKSSISLGRLPLCIARRICPESFILVKFGAAVGLGVSSSAPTWRDAPVALSAGTWLVGLRLPGCVGVVGGGGLGARCFGACRKSVQRCCALRWPPQEE